MGILGLGREHHHPNFQCFMYTYFTMVTVFYDGYSARGVPRTGCTPGMFCGFGNGEAAGTSPDEIDFTLGDPFLAISRGGAPRRFLRSLRTYRFVGLGCIQYTIVTATPFSPNH